MKMAKAELFLARGQGVARLYLNCSLGFAQGEFLNAAPKAAA